MKKFTYLFVAIAFMAVSSCQNPENNGQAAADVKITRKVMDSEVSKTVANLTIDGMTCAAGCGGKIQQELRALQGVNTTDLDFVENRPENVVTVEFDPSVTDESKMISCVQAIADGQYHVKQVEIIKYQGLQSHGRSSDAGVQSNDFGRIFQVFNLLQSLTRFAE